MVLHGFKSLQLPKQGPTLKQQLNNNIITHAPLFQGGADDVYESPLGDSRLVMNILITHSCIVRRHNAYSKSVTS